MLWKAVHARSSVGAESGAVASLGAPLLCACCCEVSGDRLGDSFVDVRGPASGGVVLLLQGEVFLKRGGQLRFPLDFLV